MEYAKAIRGEMSLNKGVVGDLESVFLGGGTPSLLPDTMIAGIMDTVHENFLIGPDAEITIEANPGALTEGKYASFLSAGINRISIGIQSLDNPELELLGRVHDAEAAIRAVRDARAAGFGNISIDLIYGIPGQDMRSWELTLEKALELLPNHVSTYELSPEKGTPLFESLRTGVLSMPDEDLATDMYYRGKDMLHSAGYFHYEISNFARSGYECRHNLNYWNRGEYLGIGAGAHSFYGGKRTENLEDAVRYAKSMINGKSVVSAETEISEGDALNEYIFLGIRKTGGLDISAIRGEKIIKAAAGLVAEGLAESDGIYLRLSRKGLMLCNEVILTLMEAVRPAFRS